MRFISRAEAAERFRGKRVAIVGSGPGVLDNPPGLVDGHDVVVRVNNYKVIPPATGRRTDVFYSFFGTSIRMGRDELAADGVTLCMAKCPDARPIDSDWHERKGKQAGIDFRPIYRRRADWWFCATYVPEAADFLRGFDLLGRHVPTTGFAAILDILSFEPGALYLTGFDFFRSARHNVTEAWAMKNADDPIRHVPERELAWLSGNWPAHPLSGDAMLMKAIETAEMAAA